MKVLVLSELWYPQGGGAELATHLAVDALKKEGFNVTVLTGSEIHNRPSGVRYVSIPLLKARSKIHLWRNLLLGRGVLAPLIKDADVVYVPRLCYPVISQAKHLGKGVIVHLHDYQPISYEADYFDGNGPPLPFSDVFRTARAEVLEGNGATRAFAGSLLSPLNKLSRFWISQTDTVICVSRRQAEIIAGALPE